MPLALESRDIIGLAETGSKKTAALGLTILRLLLENHRRFNVLILTSTREPAMRVHDQVTTLGSSFQIENAVLVGCIDMMTQAVALAKKPHIIIATPGRIIDHLGRTRGFSLSLLKYLVLDGADRISNMDSETEVDKILE